MNVSHVKFSGSHQLPNVPVVFEQLLPPRDFCVSLIERLFARPRKLSQQLTRPSNSVTFNTSNPFFTTAPDSVSYLNRGLSIEKDGTRQVAGNLVRSRWF
jgi:hypothetical protein